MTLSVCDHRLISGAILRSGICDLLLLLFLFCLVGLLYSPYALLQRDFSVFDDGWTARRAYEMERFGHVFGVLELGRPATVAVGTYYNAMEISALVFLAVSSH
jgi:hypothetical protein